MPEAIKLDPKSTALILIDMINAVAKGNGPPYNVPPNRQGVIDSFVRLVAHCRQVGTPIIYITTYRRADNSDAPKTVADVGGGGGAAMLEGHFCGRGDRRARSAGWRLHCGEATVQRLLWHEHGWDSQVAWD